MIDAEHERARSGAEPDFIDCVALDFCDPENGLAGLAGLVWVTRLPNRGQARASALLFTDGELVEELDLESEKGIDDWGEARVDGVRMTTAAGLERWSLEVSGTAASLELQVDAVTPPLELLQGLPAETTGIEQYEQFCRLSGTLTAGNHPHPVNCVGRRVHWWGRFDWTAVDRWRTLYAASGEGHAVTAATALPAGGKEHGAELRVARAVGNEESPPFEDVRVSTVYASDGMPRKAGLELWTPGAEFPRRVSGEAVCGTRIRRGGHELLVNFFRWSMDGAPAYGCYEIVRRA
jgi:hypothetical protein